MDPHLRRHSFTARTAIGLMVVIMTIFGLISIFGGKGGNGAPLAEGTYRLPSTLVSEIKDVPVSALINSAETASGDQVRPQGLPPGAPRLQSEGRPEIMFIGAPFCAPCAAERWALVMALSKFGTFKDLRGTTSSPSDIHPGGPTFSFYGATYTSKYLSFVTDEHSPSAMSRSTSSYESVQTLTAQEHKIITAWDVAPYTGQNGSIPFTYLGGKSVLTGSQFDAGAIGKMNFQTAAAVMTAGKRAVSEQVEGAAGFLVEAFCGLTRHQPARLCSQVHPG